MTHVDLREQPIDVGDIIAYTASAGQSVSGINIGLVTRFTAKSIWVQDQEPLPSGGYKPKQASVGHMEGTGTFYPGYNGQRHEHQKYVVDGYEDVGETIINSPRKDRFLILRKI